MTAPSFHRGVGAVVLLVSLLGATGLGAAIMLDGPRASEPVSEGVVFGVWRVVYDGTVPTVQVLLAAVSAALLLASGVALLERRIADRYRRSEDDADAPLAPRLEMARTRGVFAGPVTVTVLIPAHNEEACIESTLRSLESQSAAPERIVVVADNCTDRTVELARARGVEVQETVDNRAKKAGALNQALGRVLPGLGDNDTVMVMDADTVLDDGFLAEARLRLSQDRALMAVGGLFYGEDGKGVLGQFQRNEYTRYARDIRRRRGRLFVLTGTASIFRSQALREVADRRGRSIPGVHGDVYDTAALTEDNEMTIALKSLGALMTSPAGCTVVTEVMPSWRALWNQRLRWQRGALENLGAFGFTRPTVRYWAQQLGIGYGVIALLGYLALILVTAVSIDRWIWFPFWAGVGLIFVAERVITVWAGGWRARWLAVLLLPELYYATVLNVVFVKGVLDLALGRNATWTHLEAGQARPVRDERERSLT